MDAQVDPFKNIDRTRDYVRQQYKRYKKKKPPPDFKEVIDFDHPSEFADKWLSYDLQVKDFDVKNYYQVGLKSPLEWNIYELKSCPGFLVIPNPFLSAGAQSHWVHQALTEYTKKPYPNNLDVHIKLDPLKSVWQISKEKSADHSFMNRLRWCHMGYHFDYNVVNYKAKNYYGFPEDLAELTKLIAQSFGYTEYFPETGIINYYPEGTSMGCHTDHYEEELRQPLISYSFGQPAVYLIGGDTRDIKPEAIWLRSGDVMLMTGQSRTAFHGVPCIITTQTKTGPSDLLNCPLILKQLNNTQFDDQNKKREKTLDLGAACPCNKDEITDKPLWTNYMADEEEWMPFSKYLSKTRININIRQVHKAPELDQENSKTIIDIVNPT